MNIVNYDGERYYCMKNKFLDSSFIEVELNLAKKLFMELYPNPDYNTFDSEKIMDYIKLSKDIGLLEITKDACMHVLDKRRESEILVKKTLPILTSTYRALKNPNEAIKIASQYVADTNYVSVALLTSLASAYLDIKEPKTAKKYLARAQERSGNKGVMDAEVSAVYSRIEREFGDI